MRRSTLAASITPLLLFSATPLHADSQDTGRRFWGLWEAVDALDGSTEQVSISGGDDGSFVLLWRESYWSICEGRRGILNGTGEFVEDDRDSLQFSMTITCFDPQEIVLEGNVRFTLAGKNLLLATDPGVFTDLPFFRVSGRVRGGRDHDD